MRLRSQEERRVVTMLIPGSVLVSDCCHALIVMDDNDKYECFKCKKPCGSDGTLGEFHDRQKTKETDMEPIE